MVCFFSIRFLTVGLPFRGNGHISGAISELLTATNQILGGFIAKKCHLSESALPQVYIQNNKWLASQMLGNLKHLKPFKPIFPKKEITGSLLQYKIK